ncbi:MAG TPA: hypothetical protein DDW52_20340 [Planctomycetaceae bacterium]|nr:hypothetical protein [Planctomycetaceae bacterium]
MIRLLIVLGLLLVVSSDLKAQRRNFDASLAEPYRGIVTSDGIPKGLFKIESTGVSTEPVMNAAIKFLDSLTPEQRETTLFPADDLEWRKWANQHFYKRQGFSFQQMTDTQRDVAFDLLKASLSAKGLRTSKDIMKLNGTLAELAGDFEEYGEWLYHITIMGEPSGTKPWGWQLDGHHLVINYFILGDQVVMSPVFMGSEPVEAKAGKFKGTIVMQEEQNAGLAFVQTLTEQQLDTAVLSRQKPGTNNLTEAFRDNVDLDYAGICASKFTTEQQKQFLSLVGKYVGNMREGHAKVKMSEVESHLSETYFAWIGDIQEDSVFYYRIHSPVILIEFDHQRRIAPRRGRQATRDHIHSVVRTPNGNDYGKDLLRQHYEDHPHDHKK